MPRYPHIVVQQPATPSRYTAVGSGRDAVLQIPNRDRAEHANQLIGAIRAAEQTHRERLPIRRGLGFHEAPGITLRFESDPHFDLAFESLDVPRSHVRLLSVVTDEDNRTTATVHVAEGKLPILMRKLEAYRDKNVKDTQTPRNKTLVESIANIRLATLAELWTDDRALYPAAGTPIAWEVWLRTANPGEADTFETLSAAATEIGYAILSNALRFVDRVVVLVRGTREQLALGAEVLGLIAEVRKAKVTANFFAALSPSEQHEWSDDLLRRIALPPEGAPKVGLLDTGVNRGHPLLASIIGERDLHTIKPQWGVHDSHETGHGTEMAGLVIYGDLVPLLAGDSPVPLSHSLMSVKVFHQTDQHPEELFGAVTVEAVSRLEVEAVPPRVFCMTVTAASADRGRPSSWSAAIDRIAFGSIDEPRRLLIVSAGNVAMQDYVDYPAVNEASSVQDPAQAWNALTVGGYTQKTFVDQQQNPGWEPVAEHGDLAPASTTSLTWPKSPKMPFKPDIVMEAGNVARSLDVTAPDHLDELKLLTTNHRFTAGHRPFITFCSTSAAAALASRLAGTLVAQYPSFTPETMRGLIVHSARWTDAMRRRATDQHGNLDTVRLLRTFGYGVPDEEALFYSAGSSLTLIAQDEIRPFFRDDEGRVRSCEMNLHSMPWPEDALRALPQALEVELRVTLSYFVEPSPGERGWEKKYGYPSHGLRFKVKRALESLEQFRLRVNAFERDEAYEDDHAGETGNWLFGLTGPTNGSVHSNVWRGPAADLADRKYIAVHPTIGWWRTRPDGERLGRRVPYSLVVTITTADETVDIYTPVAIQVGVEVPIPV